ncbi:MULTISPECIES: DNA cytosine methyltransferase [Paenibacillus]|uniref:DNA (cytosine-5-)-methyltransferase n=1 Tax=Paenibacillus vandeheii TaxID=3035917 RepID=A0ABT8JFG0_9BACL|nr:MULTISPECIES: DNA cytosine methyltransferase [Paenibacillus]KGP81948.1 hypothetical protein P364_0114085 [Paenibacillus sp. MAEPY2]KGP86034.1 hypothetical protein P363_0119560 [Paenibacillus sp. MAEPY1]MDN4603863.1 DNA cytosine methyltransferase [Paenibacillus vandeheii]
MNLMLKKVYKVTKKAMKPRLWLYSLVCEAAGFEPGQKLFIATDVDSKQIIIQSEPITDEDHVVHVSSRKSNGVLRPIVDTAKESYRSIIDVENKVEMCVFKDDHMSRVFIRPLHFELFTQDSLVSSSDKRIRTFTICSGAGIVSSSFSDTGYFSSVGAIELDDDSSAVYRENFPQSYLYTGDLLDCNTVAESDITIVTLPCNEVSTLGLMEAGIFNNLALATTELIRSTKCRAIFMENVTGFYSTDAYKTIKDLLSDEFPFWSESTIEAHDFGSIARRKRTYVVAVRNEEDFKSFSFPKTPKSIRKRKLRDYLDGKRVSHLWKPLHKFMESFESKAEKNNSWKNRSLEKTFVTPEVTEIQCIPKRYRAQSASSTYLLSEDKQSFRFLTIEEIRRILSVPDWFVFPPYVPETRIYEMLGQSVDCRIVKSIANKIAEMFFRSKNTSKKTTSQPFGIQMNQKGQLGFMF